MVSGGRVQDLGKSGLGSATGLCVFLKQNPPQLGKPGPTTPRKAQKRPCHT